LPATADTVNKFSFTYRMFCERPGTYMYHCHVEASEHVQMGMYGPLWIYPKNYANQTTGGAAYNNYLSKFSKEVNLLLSEMDTRWHDSLLDLSAVTSEPNPTDVGGAINPGADFNPVDYRPNFWLVNGRAFPDTVFPGKYTAGYQPGTAATNDTLTYYPGVTAALALGAPVDWPAPPLGQLFAPRQPVQTYVRTAVSQKMLIRMTNMGFQYQPEHFHGVMPTIVGKDTFSWVPQPIAMFGTPTDQRKRIFTQGIFSGESYDMIAAYPDKAAISPRVYGFINEVTPVANPVSTWEPDWGTVLPAVAGQPTLQTTLVPSADGSGTLVPGFFREYPLFYLWHAHDDYRATNDGVYPGGAIALVRVDKAGTIAAEPSIIKQLIQA